MKNQKTSNQSELLTSVFDGAIQKELGLSLEDLSITLEIANMKLNSGDTMAALQIYMTLVLCNPSHYDFQCGLANSAIHMLEHDLTIQSASAMIVLNPRDARGYYFSAVGCIRLSYYNEANEDLKDARHFAELSDNKPILLEVERLQKQIALLKN